VTHFDTTEFDTAREYPQVPVEVWLRLERQRSLGLGKFLTAYAYLFRRPCMSNETRCPAVSDYYGEMTRKLAKAGLGDIEGCTDSIAGLVEKAKTLEPAIHMREMWCQVPHPALPAWMSFLQVIGTLLDRCPGLCLYCLEPDMHSEDCKERQ
jgi:hypothetical protein